MRSESLLIQWQLTLWCNYNCNYCHQQHSRHAHAFDNFPVETWIKTFEKLAPRKLAIILTGGEPFLDIKPIKKLLQALSNFEHVDNVQITTNGSWDPKYFSEIDFSKFFFYISYNPAMTSFESFYEKIKAYQNIGIKEIGINFVLQPHLIDEFLHCRKEFKTLGVKTNPNPLIGNWPYTKETLKLLKKHLPPFDFMYKTGIASPQGQLCDFPAKGLIMNGFGDLLRCHDLKIIGNLVTQGIPSLFGEAQNCKKQKCQCASLYSFLHSSPRKQTNFNFLKEYMRQIK